MINQRQKFLRSVAIGSCLLARQYGFNITVDAVEDRFSKERLKTFDNLIDFFKSSGIQINLVKIKKNELKKRAYILPAIAVMNDGASLIVTSIKTLIDNTEPVIQYIDPIDPTSKVQELNWSIFEKSWAGRFVTVVRYSGHLTKDKFFNLSWFYPEFYKFRWVLGLTFFISLLLHTLSLAPIIYIQITLDKVIGYGATDTLYVLTAGVVLTLIFNGTLTYVKNYITQYIAIAIEARISGDVFDKMLELPLGKFQTLNAVDLEKTVSSGTSLRTIIDSQILNNVFEAAGLIIFVPVLIGYSPVLATIVIIFSFSIAFLGLFLRKREVHLSGIVSKADRKKNSTLRSTIAGIDTVKVFALEDSQRQEWRQSTASSLYAITNRYKISNLSKSMQAVLQQLMTVAVIFSGVMLVFSGSLSAGAIISCNMLGGKITGPVRQMVMFFSELSNFKNIITQISELWNSPSERTGIGSQRILRGNLDFTNVSVIFDNVTALKDISWKIKEGGRVGIVGPAGSGKSTLLRLIQGLLRPNSGVFSIDGIPYSNLNLENYRLQVAMISQSSTFFDGTIESNLRRARPNISEREFSDALNWSGLRGILDELEDGLSTEIDQYASGMSSSHKIIISLARAIISNPKVILFDEVFSNIDKRLSKHVLTNLNNITRGKTFIMATHDISLLHQFDEILVLDRGSVNSTGKHSDLLKSSATYKQLYDLDVDISQGNF